jgi:hypothetical protein
VSTMEGCKRMWHIMQHTQQQLQAQPAFQAATGGLYMAPRPCPKPHEDLGDAASA